MYVQSINNTSFCAKNTYAKQAKAAISKSDRANLLSCHYEAKSRAFYIKFLEAKRQFKEMPNRYSIKAIPTLLKMGYYRFASTNCIIESYKLSPFRFEDF